MLGKEGILEILSVFAYLDIHYFEKEYEEKALVSEEKMKEFKEYLKKRLTASGIGQSIGYKEFFDFYFHFRHSLLNEHTETEGMRDLAMLYKDGTADYQQIYFLIDKNLDVIEKLVLNTKYLEGAQD